jgi:hypothetical protein
MSWFQDPASGATTVLVVLSLVVSPVMVLLAIRLFGLRASNVSAASAGTPAPNRWPPDAADDLEPYHLYFEQLNSMLEPIEPFSVEQFKQNCSLPGTTVKVRFNSEGGFTTEPLLQDGERR